MLFRSSAKIARAGNGQVSFALLVDTATSVLLSVLSEERNTAGQLISTEALLLRITIAGDRARVSESSVKPGSNPNLTISHGSP